MFEKPGERGRDNTPLYLQLANRLREQISCGGIGPGKALPSERDLSSMTGMSRVTVRKGIDLLIEEGLLFRKQGSGTFVRPQPIETPGAALSSFTDDARSRGEAPSVLWMMKAYAQPLEEEAAALEIGLTTRVARLARVRMSGGEPLAIEHAVVPAEYLPDLARVGDSLYAALEGQGMRPVSGTQRIRASLATPTEAGILSIGEKSEILRIERLTRAADGRAVEFTRSAYRGDRYVFVTDLRGGGER